MAPRRRINSRVGTHDETNASGIASALAWSVFILLLSALAVVSWIGSFYVFGHPEEPVSYRVLKTLGKLDPPKRFELTDAPRGEFLGPQQLLDRYGGLPQKELADINRLLLRDYLRNFEPNKTPVPYVIGQFTVLDSFELGDNDFLRPGIVVLGQSKQDARVLVEHLFPASAKETPVLHRLLLTGLDFNLQRRMDLSAVIHVEKLKDERIKLTAVPVLYGTYTSTAAPGTVSLEPPTAVNISAGLPVLRGPRVETAQEKFAAYGRRTGEGGDQERKPAGMLVRVQRPEAMPGEAPAPVAAKAAPAPPQVPELPEGRRVLPALPVEQGTPPGAAAALPVASPEASPSPTPADGAWDLYAPGKMPRGRLVPAEELPRLAARGSTGERVYLEGSFVVTASGENRAVLRSASGDGFGSKSQNVRIIAEFPTGTPPPIEGASLFRDALRPFLIIGISRAQDGQINVRVREITVP